MERDIFDAEHDAFRDLARTFVAKEITPFHEQWELDGQVSREVWLAAGRAGLLGTDVGLPMLMLSRHSRDRDGQPVEWVRSVYRGDRYKFVARLKRPQD